MGGNKNSGRKKGIPNKVNRLRHERFDYELLGECLKQARNNLELSQKFVSNTVLKDRWTNRLAEWESGKTTHNLTMDNLLLLCDAYGISASAILYLYEIKKRGNDEPNDLKGYLGLCFDNWGLPIDLNPNDSVDKEQILNEHCNEEPNGERGDNL